MMNDDDEGEMRYKFLPLKFIGKIKFDFIFLGNNAHVLSSARLVLPSSFSASSKLWEPCLLN